MVRSESYRDHAAPTARSISCRSLPVISSSEPELRLSRLTSRASLSPPSPGELRLKQSCQVRIWHSLGLTRESPGLSHFPAGPASAPGAGRCPAPVSPAPSPPEPHWAPVSQCSSGRSTESLRSAIPFTSPSFTFSCKYFYTSSPRGEMLSLGKPGKAPGEGGEGDWTRNR